MPITSIGSYIATAQDFIAHWTDVDADRLAATLPALTLTGGYSLADFTADSNDLQDAIDAVIGLENANVLASGDRDAQKENLLERLRQFRAALRLHFKGTSYADASPRIPRTTASQSKFTRSLADMLDVWQRLNASGGVGGFTPPLLLRGGYTQAGFDTDLDGLRTAYQDVDHAQNDLELGRRQRDQLLDPLRQRMLQYRAAIELEYAAGHPFVQSLPDVSPSNSGGPALTTFRYNFQASGSNTIAWFEMPADEPGVTNVLFREGANEFTTGVVLQPGESQQVTWEGVSITGDIDQVVLRDAENNILATGVRDTELPDPGP